MMRFRHSTRGARRHPPRQLRSRRARRRPRRRMQRFHQPLRSSRLQPHRRQEGPDVVRADGGCGRSRSQLSRQRWPPRAIRLGLIRRAPTQTARSRSANLPDPPPSCPTTGSEGSTISQPAALDQRGQQPTTSTTAQPAALRPAQFARLQSASARPHGAARKGESSRCSRATRSTACRAATCRGRRADGGERPEQPEPAAGAEDLPAARATPRAIRAAAGRRACSRRRRRGERTRRSRGEVPRLLHDAARAIPSTASRARTACPSPSCSRPTASPTRAA